MLLYPEFAPRFLKHQPWLPPKGAWKTGLLDPSRPASWFSSIAIVPGAGGTRETTTLRSDVAHHALSCLDTWTLSDGIRLWRFFLTRLMLGWYGLVWSLCKVDGIWWKLGLGPTPLFFHPEGWESWGFWVIWNSRSWSTNLYGRVMLPLFGVDC